MVRRDCPVLAVADDAPGKHGESEVMPTRSPQQPFGRGVVGNSFYSGKRPPGRTFALHYSDGFVSSRHQVLVCQRYAVLSLVVRARLLLWVCLVCVERLAVWRCRRPRRNGISTATHRRHTCSDCKRRHRYSFGLSGSRSLCRSFRSGSARSACSLFDSCSRALHNFLPAFSVHRVHSVFLSQR